MQAPVSSAFTVITAIVLAFFAAEKCTLLYEEYVMQAIIIEKDRDFLGKCQTPEGYASMNHHPNFCEKIIATARSLRLSRFDLKYGTGPLPHPQLLRCIELYGTEVAPRVREALASR